MGKTLYKGMPAPDNNVKNMQYDLKKLGFMTQAQIDTGPGWYGERTASAVSSFRRKYGITTSSGSSQYLNLHKHMSVWAVYKENGPYTLPYKIGYLAPQRYGGLSYRIIASKGNNVYVISTEAFGRCAIWAPRDNDSSITNSPSYSQGDTSGDKYDGTKADDAVLNKIKSLLTPPAPPTPPVNKNPSPNSNVSPPTPSTPKPKTPTYPAFPAIKYTPPPVRSPGVINYNLTPHSKACIVNLTTNTTIYLPTPPEDISDSVSVSIDEESVLGRSVPYVGYNNTSNRSISFSVTLHEDYCPSGVEATVNALKALEYPLYYSFTVPPKCYVNLANGIKCTAVCTSVDVVFKGPMRNNSYLMAEVSLKFDGAADVPFSADIVEKKGNNT